uniref:Uncharacterized protein n=1 Tax=Opuntia streptacantha TaxID=393608 RepID=A0A7C8ZU93_OPUST
MMIIPACTKLEIPMFLRRRGRRRHHKMSQLISDLHEILPTQKLLTVHPLYLPPKLMHQHMRLLTLSLSSPLGPPHDGGGEYCRHPPWRLRRVPSRPINENHIPINVIQMIGQIIDRQLALREEQVLHRPTLVPTVLSCVPDHLLRLAHFGRELNVVAFESGEIFLEF